MGLLIRLIAGTIGVLVASYLLAPDYFAVSDLPTAIVLALVLGLLNAIVRPILVILSFPLILLTLGLFLLVLNAILLLVAAALIPGVFVNGLIGALLASIIISVVGAIAGHLMQ
ncbi:MAG: putative rane protein [Chloroflexota bacterium]|nr:putative rane protein [Chloroflexota bacterium]